jgi:hypothetical protein
MNGSYERQFKWDLAIFGRNYQAAALGKPKLAGQEKVQPGAPPREGGHELPIFEMIVHRDL